MKFEKQKLILRQQLIGASYFEALAMMEFAERYHSGTRKDGITHEFSHQLGIALYVMTLPDLVYREETIATVFGHDLKEDFGIPDSELMAVFRSVEFASRVVEAIDCVSKKYRDEERDEDVLFERMAKNIIASIVKGADRMHNIQTMVGVFTAEKQRSYIAYAKEKILPMLKKARRNFPHQVRAYENIKFVLLSQIELIEAALDAA